MLPVVVSGDADSVWLLRKLVASNKIGAPDGFQHRHILPAKLSVISAKSLTWKTAEELLLKAVKNGTILGITDLCENTALCRKVVKLVASIPRTTQTEFRLFLCTTYLALAGFPGGLSL